jgi:hypothetical protein
VLLRLTALTGLFVGGEVWDTEVALSVLAGMSGLRELQLCDAPDFTDEGLLALSALTGLTKLGVLSCGLSSALSTFLDGRKTTDEDEEEGCFLLWKQVGVLVEACCMILDVNSLDSSFCKSPKNIAHIALEWAVMHMVWQHLTRALLVLACSTNVYALRFDVLCRTTSLPCGCSCCSSCAHAAIWSFAGSKHRSA